MSARWTLADLPDLHGRTALVTGGNGGLGLETSEALAGAGARVVLACRNLAKAESAADRITSTHRNAEVEVVELDLSSQASVRGAAKRFLDGHDHLDLLVLNAGVMAVPREITEDGWERQLATNHLGHFALTGLLLDAVLAAGRSRVVTVTSAVHKGGRIRVDDLHGERRYNRWEAYAQSKLANLLFARELQRRLHERGASTISVAAHPGYSATELQHVSAEAGNRLVGRVVLLGNRIIAQSSAAGALPTLCAATAPGLLGGELVGPDRLFEMRGHPTVVRPAKRALDRAAGERLWQVSEDLTGVTF